MVAAGEQMEIFGGVDGNCMALKVRKTFDGRFR
jgi:hypothetical protein